MTSKVKERILAIAIAGLVTTGVSAQTTKKPAPAAKDTVPAAVAKDTVPAPKKSKYQELKDKAKEKFVTATDVFNPKANYFMAKDFVGPLTPEQAAKRRDADKKAVEKTPEAKTDSSKTKIDVKGAVNTGIKILNKVIK